MSPWARGIQPHNKENSGKHRTAGSLCVGENAYQPEQRRPSSITTSSDSLHASQDELSAKSERFIIAPFTCNKSRENIRIRKLLPIYQDGCSAGGHPQWITASTTIWTLCVLVVNVITTTKRMLAELRLPWLRLLGLTNITERSMGTGHFCKQSFTVK